MFVLTLALLVLGMGTQSSLRSTGGKKDPPSPGEGPNHRAKEQIELPFAQGPLHSQLLLLCSMAQLQQRGRPSPLGRGAHSLEVMALSWAARGLDLNSLRLRVALNLHIKLPWTNAVYAIKSLDVEGCMYSNLVLQVLQNKGGAENITNLLKVGFMKVFWALQASCIGEETYCKRNSNTTEVNF